MFSCGTPLASRSVSGPLSCDGKPVLAAGSDTVATISGMDPGLESDHQRPAAAEPQRADSSSRRSLELEMDPTRGTEGDSPESTVDAVTTDGGCPVETSMPTERGTGDPDVFHSLREPRDAGPMGPIGSGCGVSKSTRFQLGSCP